MWTYSQTSGELRHNGKLIGVGYSGKGRMKNDPDQEHDHGDGPIPRGVWLIGSAHTSARTGKVVMNLTPVSHKAHGRSAFQIHGDSIRAPGTASSGCIIMNRNVRLLVSRSEDRTLTVTR